MYQSRYLNSIRWGKDSKEDFYFSARVSSENTKKLVYTVTVKLDQFGVVDEAECECGVGGSVEAHCKHVVLVLHALTVYKEGLILKETCTQKLQTFHQVKAYTGSPIKMQDMVFRDSDRMNSLARWDPRPPNMRKIPSYAQHFRSTWLNCQTPNLPIRQLYGPASVPGIASDHDYSVGSHEDHFLRSLGVEHLNPQRILEIEASTRGQAGSKKSYKKWVGERELRIHASSFGVIFNRKEKFENLAVQLMTMPDEGTVRRSRTFPADENIKSPLVHGRKYEPIATKYFEKKFGVKVKDSGICLREDIPFIGCSPDGLVGEDTIDEVKCPFTAREKPIDSKTVPYLIPVVSNTPVASTSQIDPKVTSFIFFVLGNFYCALTLCH